MKTHLIILFTALLFTLTRGAPVVEDKSYYTDNDWSIVEKSLLPGNVISLYYSNTDLNNLLASYYTNFPDLIASLITIGQTFQGQNIYAVQLAMASSGSTVRSNTDIGSFTNSYSNRPAILFTGMHDGNDPISMTMVLYILKRFVYGYVKQDAEYLYLLKTRQIWLVPAVNRDAYDKITQGYSYIKNMDVGSASCSPATLNGVNLRLNYQLYPGKTTSHGVCDVLYEGASPFSEPETQAIKALTGKVSFKIALNFFARNNTVLVPLNYLSQSDVTSAASASLYTNSVDKDIFSEIFNKAGLTLGTTYGNNYGILGQAVQGEVSDYMYHYKNVYALTVELGYQGIANTVFPLSFTQNFQVLDYFYNMTLYSTHKLGLQVEWTQLYQLMETCLDQHLTFINCNKGDTTIKVYSAKFQLENYGFSAEESLNILISSTSQLEIVSYSVQDSYSQLFDFQDTNFVQSAFPSDGEVPAVISARTPKYISIIGLYNSAATSSGTVSLSVVGEYSFNNSQSYTVTLADYGGVKGFTKIVVDDAVKEDNIRRPSIILIIVYFVSLAVVFVLGMSVYGASKYSRQKAPKNL